LLIAPHPRGNMTGETTDVVTGAFSYTGSFVARRLLRDGVRVRTLTRRDDPSSPL
jgi:nucleoside-diphosphate-sugar epimerase